ncbi:MAG: orotidine-5'-phosphate decarboxylase [Rhodothermales bacterium]
MTFARKLTLAQENKRSLLCIGLDPDLPKLPDALRRSHTPAEAIVAFNAAIIEATKPYASAYKINFAFYEAFGAAGWEALEKTRRLLPDDTIAIADAKRGDIGNSAQFYARSVFEDLGFDACTVSPYMGGDSVEPFLQFPGKAIFILARTSNPGGADLQELEVDGEKLYLRTARLASQWDGRWPGEAGLVVGASDAGPVRAIREACPSLPFLIPGIGAQGGDARSILQAAGTGYGLNLVNSSRNILFASSGADFAEASAQAALRQRDELNAVIA